MERHDVYIFNPENDLALAHGGDNYTAPPRARQLRHDLQLLPAWVAPPGSLVLVDGRPEQANRWLQEQQLPVVAVAATDIASLGPCRYHPWGWSRALRNTLMKWGARPDDLPDNRQLDDIRHLSHRRTTIALHRAVASLMGAPLCAVPVELFSMDDVRRFVDSHPGCFLKIPLSGSGRGVYHVTNGEDPYLWQWAEGALRRQGSLMGELGAVAVMDMAIEFTCKERRATPTGYSIFFTDRHCQYAGNRVDRAPAVRRSIVSRCPQFDRVEQAVTQAVQSLFATSYDGPLGVDMLLYRHTDGTLGINPCVEANVRFTMGAVAAGLGERHNLRGTFRIGSNPPPHARLLTPPGGSQVAFITDEFPTLTHA